MEHDLKISNSTSDDMAMDQLPPLPGVSMYLIIETNILLVVGVIVNIIILAVMPFTKIPGNTKALLWFMAITDIGSLIESDLLETTLPALMPLIIGKPFAYKNLSEALCKLDQFSSEFFELATQWLSVAVACERFYVVYFPFRASKLSQKKALIGIAAILVISVLITFPHILYTSIQNGSCSFNAGPAASETFFYVRHVIAEHFLPQLVVVIVNGFIMAALVRRQRLKRHLSAGGNKSESMSKSNLKITIGLVILSIAHTFLYGQCGIACVVYDIYYNYYNAQVMDQMYLVSGSLYLFAHVINFFLYITTIDAFRSATISCCKLEYLKK